MKSVKLDNLGERLVREVKRNKAKSAVLGVLCLVALYFWVPLVWKWTAGGSSAQAPPPDVAANFLAQPAASVTASTMTNRGVEQANESKAAKHSWRDIVRWIGQDQRMTAATRLQQTRSPFRPAEPVAPPDQADEPAEVRNNNALGIAADEMSLEDFGLELTSTLVGRRYRIAKINGMRYRENESIVIQLDGETGARSENGSTVNLHEIELKLTEIHSSHVVLALGERKFDLPLSRPDLAASGRIDSSSPAGSEQ